MERLDRRYPELDGLRGIAIFMVMAFHFLLVPRWLHVPLLENSGILVTIISHMIHVGWIGVDLFFILSGFLITRILIHTKDKKSYFKNFYARRALRIFPLYYLALLVWIYIEDFFPLGVKNGIDEHYLSYLFSYTSNFLIVHKGWSALPMPLVHFWTLAIEEQYYLIWPIFIHFLNKKSIMILCFVLFLSSLCVRHVFLTNENHLMANIYSFSRLYALIMGSFLALVFHRDFNEKKIAAIGIVSALVIISYLFLAEDFYFKKVEDLVPVVAVFFVSIVALASLPGKYNFTRTLKHALQNPFLVWMGRRSYCFYIVHQFIIVYFVTSGLSIRLMPLVIKNSVFLTFLYYFIFPFAVTAIIGEISWNVFESKFLRLKKYF